MFANFVILGPSRGSQIRGTILQSISSYLADYNRYQRVAQNCK